MTINRREWALICITLVLIGCCVFQQRQIRVLREDISNWRNVQFELTNVLADIQRRLYFIVHDNGLPTSLAPSVGESVYRLSLLSRDEFGSVFLKFAEKLKLMAITADMFMPNRNRSDSRTTEDVEEYYPDRWPTQGTITSLFGVRKHPIYKKERFHAGVDIANFKNTEVLAAASGTVKFAGADGGYGNAVILDHGNGYESLYGHAEDILVRVGDVVKKGELIASMGSTGLSTGEHLHFEVRFAGEAVDPTVFVK